MNFDDIPDEIVVHIFSYLRAFDILSSIQFTSKTFRQCSKKDYFWESILDYLYDYFPVEMSPQNKKWMFVGKSMKEEKVYEKLKFLYRYHGKVIILSTILLHLEMLSTQYTLLLREKKNRHKLREIKECENSIRYYGRLKLYEVRIKCLGKRCKFFAGHSGYCSVCGKDKILSKEKEEEIKKIIQEKYDKAKEHCKLSKIKVEKFREEFQSGIEKQRKLKLITLSVRKRVDKCYNDLMSIPIIRIREKFVPNSLHNLLGEKVVYISQVSQDTDLAIVDFHNSLFYWYAQQPYKRRVDIFEDKFEYSVIESAETFSKIEVVLTLRKKRMKSNFEKERSRSFQFVKMQQMQVQPFARDKYSPEVKSKKLTPQQVKRKKSPTRKMRDDGIKNHPVMPDFPRRKPRFRVKFKEHTNYVKRNKNLEKKEKKFFVVVRKEDEKFIVKISDFILSDFTGRIRREKEEFNYSVESLKNVYKNVFKM